MFTQKSFEIFSIDGLEARMAEIRSEIQPVFSEIGQKLLTELSAKEAEMYVVSNGTSRVSRPRIFESGISDHFREIFISEEVGHHKPSLAFFDYVFDHIEAANKKEFTIVGDSLATDILGGNRAGIKTIWYNPKQLEVTGEAQPDVQIQDLLEIPSLVKNW